MNNAEKRIKEGLDFLRLIGMPEEQINKRSSLALLALLDLKPEQTWSQSNNPLIGITPIMNFAKVKYDVEYAPNSREMFRRFTMHQFVEAGIVIANPDKPERPTNSPSFVYQIEPKFLEVARQFRTSEFSPALAEFYKIRSTLKDIYARERIDKMVQITVDDKEIVLTPGQHNKLIKAIVEVFSPIFIPGSELVYMGDTGDKWGFYDEKLFKELNISTESHGKMPDVVFFYREKGWLILVESVTSHGPVDHKRRIELERLFSNVGLGLVYVSAFLDKKTAKKYMKDIAWESEVWIASAPTHMIHFNGDKFLGPHKT